MTQTKEIREEIEKVLRSHIERKMSESELNEYAFHGFLLKRLYYHVADGKECAIELAKRLVENANVAVMRDFVETFFGDDDEFSLKICDTCGNWMLEGYYLAGEYACCEECAILNYMNESYNHSSNGKVSREKATELFHRDLDLDEKNCLGEVYYTDWR